jgi:hypothetical protein
VIRAGARRPMPTALLSWARRMHSESTGDAATGEDSWQV